MTPMVRQPLGIELALLGFLSPHPRHGYDIYQQLTEVSGLGTVWRLKQSHLYALLAKLEQEGYLASTFESQEPKPPRKVYTLTEAGWSAFRRWRVAPVAHGRAVRLEFLTKLYFARQAGGTAVESLLAVQRGACRAWCDEQQAVAERYSPDSYEWLICQFRIGQIEAIVRWLDLCAVHLAAPPP